MMCFVRGNHIDEWSAVRGDHIDEWSAKSDGMINIFCNYKECFKRNAFVENIGLSFACNMQIQIISNREFFRGSL